ncbi:hypothetical protein COH20_000668 [Aspergillus flavus]|uniref:NADH dehydrogenase [ubiquinone] 1 alpha subcomplex subunit 1 n=1 Tax=Aspergillus flavus TaxID=5059 RepID=A0AB74C0H9_ASPFL|nr:hypothetical protein COH20_000668 [Aspergillus flavus]RAQ78861.1 hypothetical protein COH21_003928 [Aspergillus flavus]RMZ40040.1 hypothetical protein CA14_000676 [Aspergillus flavus]
MGVPFEALIPYGIIVGMFGVTGAGLTAVKWLGNEGKKARWNRDLWDRVLNYPTVMERDLRITGTLRGQSGNAEAPKGFELSNPWKLEKRIF